MVIHPYLNDFDTSTGWLTTIILIGRRVASLRHYGFSGAMLQSGTTILSDQYATRACIGGRYPSGRVQPPAVVAPSIQVEHRRLDFCPAPEGAVNYRFGPSSDSCPRHAL